MHAHGAAPDSPSRPVPKPPHRLDIQGLRALAVLVVVIYHTGLAMPGGFVGVDMFFVISGFVITRQVLWEHESKGRLDLSRFYLRRIKRIIPALTLLIVGVSIMSPWLAPLSGRSESHGTAVGAAVINANNYLAGLFRSLEGNYFNPRTDLNVFLHTWSLSVEEQFYLIFPLLIAGAGYLGLRNGRGGDRRWILGALGLVVVMSFVATQAAMDTQPTLAFYLAPLRAWEFAAGALLVGIEGRMRSAVGAQLVGSAGAAAFLGAVFLFDDSTVFPGVMATIPVVATVAMIQAGSMGGGLVTSLLSRPSAVYVGGVSYSWYLWHWPLMVFAFASAQGSTVALLLASVVSLGIAGLSTRYFEDRIRYAQLTAKQTVVLGLGCIVLSLIAIDVGTRVANGREEIPEMLAFGDTFDEHWATTSDCGHIPAVESGCFFPIDDGQGSVLLLGDSNAQQLVEGAVAGFNGEGYDVTLAYVHSCPFMDARTYFEGDEQDRCRAFVQSTLRVLESNPFDLIVFANSTEQYVERSEYTFEDESGRIFATPDERANFMRSAMPDAFSALSAPGARVVFVESMPKLPGWYAVDCSTFTWETDPALCAAEVSRSSADEYRSRGRSVEAAIQERTNPAILSLDDVLCAEDVCSALSGGQWRFLDYGHITVAQSEELAPMFAAMVSG